MSGARIMKTSQRRQAVENRCVFSARLKALSDRSSDRSAGGRRFHVAGPLTAKLRCLVAVRARGTSRVPVAADHKLSWLSVSFLLHVKYTLSYRIVSYRQCGLRN